MAERWPMVGAEARFNAVVDEYGKFLSNTIANLCPKDLGLQFNDIEAELRVALGGAGLARPSPPQVLPTRSPRRCYW